MIWWQIVLCVLVGLLVFSFIMFFVIGEICYSLALKRHSFVGRQINAEFHEMMETFKINYTWWDEVESKPENIKSKDKIKLHGAIIEKNKKKIAIIVHGYMSNYMDMQRYAKVFYDFGYTIIAPDNRGHGRSGGKETTMGYKDKYDILCWIDYAIKRFGEDCEIVVFGASMGGATVCMLSGQNLPKNVKAIISDCAYDSVYNVFSEVIKKVIKLPLSLTMSIFNLYAKMRAGFRLKQADAIKDVKNCKVPIMFIHGDKDQLVPYKMQQNLYDHTPKELRHKHTFKNAGHCESLPKNPEEYTEVIKEFLKISSKTS